MVKATGVPAESGQKSKGGKTFTETITKAKLAVLLAKKPEVARPLIVKKFGAKNWNLRCRIGKTGEVFCAGAVAEGNYLHIKNQYKHFDVIIPINEIKKQLRSCNRPSAMLVFTTSVGDVYIGCGSLQKIPILIPE